MRSFVLLRLAHFRWKLCKNKRPLSELGHAAEKWVTHSAIECINVTAGNNLTAQQPAMMPSDYRSDGWPRFFGENPWGLLPFLQRVYRVKLSTLPQSNWQNRSSFCSLQAAIKQAELGGKNMNCLSMLSTDDFTSQHYRCGCHRPPSCQEVCGPDVPIAFHGSAWISMAFQAFGCLKRAASCETGPELGSGFVSTPHRWETADP